MKLAGKDLKRLSLPIGACLVLAVVGIGSYFPADNYLKDTKKLRESILAQRSNVRGTLARATEEEREIRANLQQYRALEARGIIGGEKRLDWVDSITAIKSERRLFNIGYTIEPQKPLDYPGFSAAGGAGFMASRLKLEMALLHEEDLLHFIDDLARRGKSHVSVRNCNVQRASRDTGTTTLAPRLRAVCNIDLITVRDNSPR